MARFFIKGITEEQEQAVKLAQNDAEMTDEQTADMEIAVFEIAEATHQSIESVKRFLGIAFMLCICVLNCFDNADTQRVARVRTRTRKEMTC